MSDPSRKINRSSTPRLIILGSDQAEVHQLLEHVKPVLSEHAEIVHEDLTFSDDLTNVEADLVIVFGGDGSILRSARQMGAQQLPVLGVNLGKLGFLADIATDELVKVFPDICAGNYSIVEHLMLSCEVNRDGQQLIDRLGLNEVAILGGPPFSLMEVDLYVDAELATTYSCDGLIISTPVGSTAHSLVGWWSDPEKESPGVRSLADQSAYINRSAGCGYCGSCLRNGCPASQSKYVSCR